MSVPKPAIARLLRPILLGSTVLASTAALADGSCPAPTSERHRLDWVPLDELDAKQLLELPTGCCGAYRAPERTDEDADTLPERAPIRTSADHLEGQRDSLVLLEGDVRLTQGYRSVNTQRAQINRDTGDVELTGAIALREPGLLLRAERAEVNIDSGSAQLEDAEFVLHEFRVHGGAEELRRVGEREVIATRGHFTSCEPHDSFWRIHAGQITLRPDEHYGTAHHARLTLKGLPVLYTPYVRFPLGEQRLTGFLAPSFSGGTRSRNGVQVSLPFYWNIAPQADMTITPRYMSARGTLWGLETRHLGEHFDTTVSGAFLADDRGGNRPLRGRQAADDQRVNEGNFPYLGENRWNWHIDQLGGDNQPWSSQIDYTEISDTDYVRDLGGASLESRRMAHIHNQAHFSYQFEHWRAGISAAEERSLIDSQKPYRELPRLTLQGQYRWGLWLLELDNEATRFDVNAHFDDPRHEDIAVGDRLRTDYRLTLDFDSDWGFIKPGVGYRTLNYRLEESRLAPGAEDRPGLSAGQVTLDTGLYFDRFSEGGWLHTIEPRALYFYSERADHSELLEAAANNRPINFDTRDLNFTYDQVFRTTRFSGGDRIDDADQLAAGLTQRLVNPQGQEVLRASIGQIFYFKQRRVGLTAFDPDDDEDPRLYPDSEVAAHLSGRLGERLGLNANVTYNPHRNEFSRGNFRLRYLDERFRIFNLAYTYTRRPEVPDPLFPERTIGRSLDQIDASTIWPVGGNWHLIARGNYDFTYERELDAFAGIEYADCCYRVRVIARRWLDFDYTPDFMATVTDDDYDEGLFVELELRGLGSIADRIGAFLSDEIIGYDAREQFLR